MIYRERYIGCRLVRWAVRENVIFPDCWQRPERILLPRYTG